MTFDSTPENQTVPKAVWGALAWVSVAALSFPATAADTAPVDKTAAEEQIDGSEDTKETPANIKRKPATKSASNQASQAKNTDGAEEDSDDGKSAGTTASTAKTLGNVTVTAQRRRESVQKVPTAITVLGSKKIIDEGIGRSSSEILNYVPNASAGTQLHGRPRWWIRGLGTGHQQIDLSNQVGFYTDDVYIANATATGFPLFDLERVEVLRGPQGTLWGKNTTGGAINLISRRPSFTPNGYLRLGYGTYEDIIAEGAYGGALNDAVAVRGAFHYESQNGRFNTQDPVTQQLTGENQGGFEDAMFRISALSKITPDLEALVNVHYRNYSTHGSVDTQIAASPDGVMYTDPLTGYTIIPSRDRDVISTTRRTPITDNDVQQKGVVLNLQQKLGRYTLVGITGYEDWTSETTGNGPNKQSSDQFSQEIRLLSPREDRWNWIAGFHYFREHINSNTYSSTLPCGVGLTTTQIRALPNGGGCLSTLGRQAFTHNEYDHENESFAVFGSTTFNFTEQLLATVGARYTHETKDVDLTRQQASFTPAGGTFNYNNRLGTGAGLGNGALTSNPLFFDVNNWWHSVNPAYLQNSPTATATTATNFSGKKHASWDLWTYDVTPEYRITDNAMVYFKHSKGLKSGGFNTGATQRIVLDTVIKPERIFAYELGTKTTWFGGRLRANASLFYYDYANAQLNITAVPDPNVPNNRTGYIYNVKQAHSQGAEFELEALPFQDLHIIGNLGFLDTRFDDVSNIDQTGVPDRNQIKYGNEFVRSPHITGYLNVDYRLPFELPGDTHLVASSDWRYQDKQFYYVNFQDDSDLSRLIQQPAYSIVNFRLTLASRDEKLALMGYLNNAFDQVYLNHSLTPGNFNGASNTWGQPRTIGLQLTARF